MSPTETLSKIISPPAYGSEAELLAIDTIRTLAADAVQAANSGHPGAPMGLAPAAYVLWTRFLRHNPANPGWANRDRFVLSCGHASMLLYSLLYLTGYGLELEDIKNFRQRGSLTPGHPEYRHTKGVETTTGPLGAGFATGVGMAIAERILADRFNKPGFSVVNHFTYAFCSDGDVMEGVSHEAASLAGHLRLGKLIYLYDANEITIDGPTSLAFTEDVGRRFEAYQWHVQHVYDGNDLDALTTAYEAAQADPRPSIIVTRTHIGYGAPTRQDSELAHGQALGEDEVRGTKIRYGWDPDKKFFVPDEALATWRKALDRGTEVEGTWTYLMDRYRAEFPEDAAELERVLEGRLPEGWDADLPTVGPEKALATRVSSNMAINAAAGRLPELIGGSADLTGSNGTEIKGGGVLGPEAGGRNIHYGVREHAMGSILNGMALHGGVRPFGGTFLIFSDYMRPAVRLAALMAIPSIFVYSHDSIGQGEDGPTHQPVEHLASLRAMPGLCVIRPADANEAVEAWRVTLSQRSEPVALVLTRQNVPTLDRTRLAPAAGLAKGAYVLSDPPAANGGSPDPDLILIGTGSEVFLCVEAADRLTAEGVRTRVVSMPSWELFERQPQSYRDEVLPPAVRARLSVECLSTFGWERYVGEAGGSLGLDHFGASAPGGTLLAEFGFTVDNVVAHARAVLEKQGRAAAPLPTP
ncbi:MAG TPA: transketolase [Actinomycetota bacterium]|nr:transketolase [Actinomycetota bacterium]